MWEVGSGKWDAPCAVSLAQLQCRKLILIHVTAVARVGGILTFFYSDRGRNVVSEVCYDWCSIVTGLRHGMRYEVLTHHLAKYSGYNGGCTLEPRQDGQVTA